MNAATQDRGVTSMNRFFNKRFDEITKVLPYDTKWANGTGYFDGAANGPDEVKLAPGELAKSTDDKDRNMIFIGTRLGTVVVFERFSGGEDGVFTINASPKFERLGYVFLTNLPEQDLIRLIGAFDFDNAGAKIERAFA